MADPEVDLFAGMKKKKKKQVVLDTEEPTQEVEATPEPSTSTPAAAPAISAPVEDEAGSGAATPAEGDKPAEDGGDLFADLKKKKKKKKDIPLDLVCDERNMRRKC